jgi:hypothetical protein
VQLTLRTCQAYTASPDSASASAWKDKPLTAIVDYQKEGKSSETENLTSMMMRQVFVAFLVSIVMGLQSFHAASVMMRQSFCGFFCNTYSDEIAKLTCTNCNAGATL